MAIALRSFLDLLPHRIDQAVAGRAIRRLRLNWQRDRGRSTQKHVAVASKRLFVDLAVISKHDAGTGIQRVVRALALALAGQRLDGWEIHFVSANRRKAYHCISWPGNNGKEDSREIEARPGDVFLGLDYSLDTIRWHRRQLSRFRRGGGALWFLVHDMLPLERPDWFSRNTIIRYRAWLGIMAGVADGFLCNSDQTERGLKQALDRLYGLVENYRTIVLPMGHDILDSVVGDLGAAVSGTRLHSDRTIPLILMVGTLEPRKGHADIVAAFDEMWRLGREDRLVLVGRLGWQVEALHGYIVSHPEYGRKLFWFDDVEDCELLGFYSICDGAIIASHGEGFGLPLIEALGHGKPVLARDLPIFHAHADRGVRFFPVNADPKALAIFIQAWIDKVREGAILVVPPDTSWKESARMLLASVTQKFD